MLEIEERIVLRTDKVLQAVEEALGFILNAIQRH